VGLCLGLTALAQQRPVVALSADRTSGLAPMQVHLVARGSPPSATNLSSARYSWDFGDRTVGQGANATHTYKDAGTYRVSVVYTRFVQGPEEQQYATNIVTLTVTNKPQIDV
jgi:hypothetical protein